MYRKLTNLLPLDRVATFRRDYFLRLATVGVCLLIVLIVAHGVLLFPSYLTLSMRRDGAAAELAKVNGSLENSKEGEVSARLAALKGDAIYLARLGSVPSASAAVRALLRVSRPGIRITSLAFTPPTASAADGKMTVSGVASTREALRAYDLALSGLPFVSNVDLPINAYSNEADISFNMVLTGTLTP